MNSSITLYFIYFIGVLFLFSIWVLLHIKGNFNKVWICITIIFFLFILVLIKGNAFTSCVFGVIYVGAMSILFIVFLSYTGTEVETETKVMSSGSSIISLSFFIIICYTPLISESALALNKEFTTRSTGMKEATPEYFCHFYTTSSFMLLLMLLALIVGLVTTLTVVGVYRWSKNSREEEPEKEGWEE